MHSTLWMIPSTFACITYSADAEPVHQCACREYIFCAVHNVTQCDVTKCTIGFKEIELQKVGFNDIHEGTDYQYNWTVMGKGLQYWVGHCLNEAIMRFMNKTNKPNWLFK